MTNWAARPRILAAAWEMAPREMVQLMIAAARERAAEVEAGEAIEIAPMLTPERAGEMMEGESA